MTHSPMLGMRPAVSATGMKTEGGIESPSPCGQRSSASTWTRPAAAQGEDRLEEQPEGVLLQGVAQALLEAAAVLELGVHGGCVEAPDAAPRRLGPVQGQIGVAEQALGGLPVLRRQGGADAGVDADLAPVELERGGGGAQHAGDHRLGPCGGRSRRSAQGRTCRRRGRPACRSPPPGPASVAASSLSTASAHGVAEGVVDVPGMVEVEKHEGHPVAGLTGPA